MSNMNTLKVLAPMRVAQLCVVAMLTLVMTPADSAAQSRFAATRSVSAGGGWGALWDDETHLGRGVPMAGGAALTIRERVVVRGDVDWTSHVRDSGYLRAESQLIGLFARMTCLLGTPGSRVRPLFGAGLGALHSSGTLIVRNTVFGPNGQPSPGPDERTPWTLTRPAAEVHGGLQIPLSGRVSLRTEGRWRATLGRAESTALEPPLIGIQGMVHVDIGL